MASGDADICCWRAESSVLSSLRRGVTLNDEGELQPPSGGGRLPQWKKPALFAVGRWFSTIFCFSWLYSGRNTPHCIVSWRSLWALARLPCRKRGGRSLSEGSRVTRSISKGVTERPGLLVFTYFTRKWLKNRDGQLPRFHILCHSPSSGSNAPRPTRTTGSPHW